MIGLVLVVVAVLVVATVAGLVMKARSGRVVATPATDLQAPMLAEHLRGRLGSNATMVQFSSAFCQPCRATRRVLEEVAVMVPGVSHVEIDAEENLDLVRALDIRRTPTVLFLGPTGEERERASGQPRKADVVAALGRIMDGSGDVSI